MGFSTNLQGKIAHEALLSRQDAELRLLECVKRCVVSKVKCDRDYAASLSGAAAQGLKFDRSDELSGLCVVSKVKCDRDYSASLSGAAAQGLKFDRSDELSGSLVATSWRSMMEEMDCTAKAIRQNADAIESKCLDALNALYADKRKARKAYQEEHSRILQQFTHVSHSLL
ncbi:unnamed protein product [Phaedon cochleariae]|uniref:F-BAR domain-containing protein n=1 Tax=Phaedon cochleariae TaxID=80249 RepID=A0A9N9SI73_PHACE|nr:unnamed protein product [Phaedon cochleariae]